MQCVTHTSEKVLMVCKSCDKYPFVCGVCLEEEHAEHKVQTLRNAAQSIRQNLEQVETDNEQVFKEIKSDLDGLTKVREDLQQEANRVDADISKRADTIRSKIDDVNTEVIQEHKIELDRNKQVINGTEEALKQQVSKIDTFKMKVAQLQKMNDYVEVINVGRDVEVPDTGRIPRPDLQTKTFIPGTVGDGELRRIFGGMNIFDSSKHDAISAVCADVTSVNDDKINTSSDFIGLIERESDIKVKPVASFKLIKNDGINTMFCSKPGVCWLKCQDKNSVKLSNRSGEIIQAINLETKTKGFTVTSDNRLLFCCTTQECVKEMKIPNGEITEKFSTSPLTPNFICTCPSGEIYVTLFDENDYQLEEHSTRVLVKYNRRGREKARCGERLFVVPEEVCVNNTGTQVAVINLVNYNRRELVVLDQELSPLFVYTGPSVLTGRSLAGFLVNGVTFDARNNILIVELYSQTVQLLSPSCELLQVMATVETYPWSLSMRGDEVWVGNGEGRVQIFRYSYSDKS